ncbi:hypothetical protein [Methylobacterium aerolatum]|uniref:Uncharacterized protein n=1 Tax=Methylobacterium aerolatum TaxID=418708 RepID=A0ABU0I1V4_9HYPH|nr:hypothetical protein [Methylobacterium aerolatum]MDQ0448583.1 hypothetical protein [Methylobacterium aerolatum]GJD33200.1 hypothetical protein FMGBMHLM_0085 [Methylobacterium aerolatum]
MPRRRTFDALSEAQLAAGRMAPRRVAGIARFRPCAPRPVGDLLDAIEHVAEAATGDRSFLHVVPRGGRDDPAA